MALPAQFTALSGEWKGTKSLYLNGESGPVRESGSRLTIARAARDCYLMLAYTWKFEADPHEGILLLGYDEAARAATAAWGDSWHMSRKIMHCAGTITASKTFTVNGYYEAPPDPDWGWRIAVEIRGENSIALVMHNISPAGQEDLAVRAVFARTD